MSIKVMSWVFEQNLNPTQKIILMALADHCDDSGKCWPGLNGISEKCNLHISTIQRNIHKLEDDGFIRITERKRPNGSQTSNLYQLNIGGVANCDQGGGAHATPRTVTVNKLSIERGKQISDDFEITPKMINWLGQKRPELIKNAESITESFIDYWKSKGEPRKDWVAAWRNWMRNHKETRNVSSKTRKQASDPQSILDRFNSAAGIDTNTSDVASDNRTLRIVGGNEN
jgi:hypothetical protein